MRPLKLTTNLVDELTEEFRKQLESHSAHTDRINYSKNLSDIFKKTTGSTPFEKVCVNFTPDTYLQMMQLVNTCTDEIGWHGTVQRVSEKKFIIDKILVFPQIVSGTEVTPDETEFNKWMLQFFEDDEDDTIQRMRFHGHSHVNMGTTPSGTDDRYQGEMLGNIKDYYIFLITNKRAEHNIMIYDVKNNLYLEKSDITLGIELTDGTSLASWTTEQMKQVTHRSAVTTAASIAGYPGYRRETSIVTRPEMTVEDYHDQQQIEMEEERALLEKQTTIRKNAKAGTYYDPALKLWVVVSHKGKKQFFVTDPRRGGFNAKAGVNTSES